MIFQRFQRFMVGRYGSDSLSKFLTVLSILFFVLSFVWSVFYLPAVLFMACNLFRTFSRNTWKRSRENQMYLQVASKVRSKLKPVQDRFRQRKTHRFFRCTACRTTLRVLKGKGRIKITCPKCHTAFERQT